MTKARPSIALFFADKESRSEIKYSPMFQHHKLVKYTVLLLLLKTKTFFRISFVQPGYRKGFKIKCKTF